MATKEEMSVWVGLSKVLFHGLKPAGAGFEIAGHGMEKSEFAFLVHRETLRVNEALLSMALAKDGPDIQLIFDALSEDTVTVLLSRWAHYHGRWKEMLNNPDPSFWVPPDQRDMWRAIFLAMAGQSPAVTAAQKEIWPEYFGE